MIIFYAPDILTDNLLPESDSQHCIRVLRKGAGDLIDVIDGKGNRFTCRILDPHPKRTAVEVVERQQVIKPWSGGITIGIAPTKNMDRMEWAVEKLTEIGVDRIVPLLCRHSERKDLKRERLEKIAVSAMKQSLKATLPQIDGLTPIKQLLNEGAEGSKFIAYCDKTIERRLLSRSIKAGEKATIIIGPEGDFSPEEVEMALKAGYQPVSLGDCRLRTETAAIVACDTFLIVNQMSKE